MAVNDFASLLLGEAGGKNATERYNDMLHIASVVVNRAAATGRSVEDIMANSREFNAWGKGLPAGAEQFRGLAEQAIKQVMEHGPVTNATFYATPSKTGNLPGGLQAATRTASHEFFTDPQNRAIGTASGYAQVQPVNTETVPPLPLSAPKPYGSGDMRMMAFEPPYAGLVPPTTAPAVPSAREITPGAGLANLAPNGLNYELAGKGRSEIPSSGIGGKVAAAAQSVDPGITTVMFSGQEPAGRAPVGTEYRHPLGYAGDFYFQKDGKALTDQQTLKDIAQTMAAQHKANIGIGPGYMGADRMHIDTMPLGGPYPGGPQWGSTAKSWAADLNEARQYALMPPSYYARELPATMQAPAPRPDPSLPAQAPAPAPNFAGGISPVPAPTPMPAIPAMPFAPTPAVPAAFAAMPMPSPQAAVPGPASVAMPAPAPVPGLPPVAMPSPMPFAPTDIHFPGSLPVPTFPKGDFVPRGPSLPNYPGVSPWATNPMTSAAATIAEYLGFGPQKAAQPNFAGGISPRAAQEQSMAALPSLPPTVPQNVIDAYTEYGRSRAAAPASVPQMPAIPPSNMLAPPMAPPTPMAPPVGLPAAPPVPTPSPRNGFTDAKRGAMIGGLPGAIAAPAIAQIGRNARSNMQGQRMGLFDGIRQAYRDAGQGFAGLFGGPMPAPSPFSVGTGLGAIQSILGGGMAPGATAYSASAPGASWSVNAYGLPEYTSQHGFTGVMPDNAR